MHVVNISSCLDGDPHCDTSHRSEYLPLGIPSQVSYHWRELPQVSFLSQQKFCRNKQGFSQQNTSFVATKECLWRQNVCRDEHIFVQARVCRDKTRLLYGMLVATNYLSRQTRVVTWYACRHKLFVATNTSCHICRDKRFVAAGIHLLRQKTCVKRNTCSSRQKFCRDKNYTCGQLPPMIVSKHPSFLALKRPVRPPLRVV